MNPGIACVMPTIGRPELAYAVVKRLLSQSIAPVCVVVVDASHGESLERLRTLLGGLEAGSVIHVEARAASLTGQRNEGILRALGLSEWSFIQFMDDDVTFAPDFLETAVTEMVRGGWDGLCGATDDAKQLHDSSMFERVLGLQPPQPGLVSAIGRNAGYRYDPTASVQRAQWILGCAMYRREVVERSKFWEQPGYVLYEDVEFSSRLATQGGKVAWLPALHLGHMELSRANPDHYRAAYQGTYNRAKVLVSMERPIGVRFWWSVAGLAVRAAGSAAFGRAHARLRLQGYLRGALDVRRDFASTGLGK